MSLNNNMNAMNLGSVPKVSRRYSYNIINIYRDQQIQDIKPHYANILVHPRAAVMGINVSLPMEIKNCD